MIINPVDSIRGTLRVPGDKSIAHRALILGAIARGRQFVDGVPASTDVLSTSSCLRSLGVFVEEMPDGRILILQKPFRSGTALDAGNSGTSARLLAGMLAGQRLKTSIDGDESLRRRPMERIAVPLRAMGASIETTNGRLPMSIEGAGLRGIRYELPVASAQVKSAILIAGLFARGKTTVIEPLPSRDHTERMLRAMDVPVGVQDGHVTIEGPTTPSGCQIRVPADMSSAAYAMVAAICLPDSEVYFPAIGVNPTRAGLLSTLVRMGADIEQINEDSFQLEPIADLIVKSSPLQGVVVNPAAIPSMIDELPVLAVAATQAEGDTVVRGAAELRHKESDRIEAIAGNLRRLGARIETLEDGFVVQGPVKLKGTRVSSFGDHRIAMAMAVAAFLADGKTEIDGAAVVDVSYPSFFDDVRTVVR